MHGGPGVYQDDQNDQDDLHRDRTVKRRYCEAHNHFNIVGSRSTIITLWSNCMQRIHDPKAAPTEVQLSSLWVRSASTSKGV